MERSEREKGGSHGVKLGIGVEKSLKRDGEKEREKYFELAEEIGGEGAVCAETGEGERVGGEETAGGIVGGECGEKEIAQRSHPRLARERCRERGGGGWRWIQWIQWIQ